MIGYDVTRQGRYRCTFCPHHRSWVTQSAAVEHVQTKHELEHAKASIDEWRNKFDQLSKKPPKVEIREKVVYKEKPKPKYWYIENGGGIYCETCKIVQMRVGIPEGQTIENTPHECGNRTLKLVLEVR